MNRPWTEADFELLSWHDCHVWRIDFLPGEPDEDDWTSDLALGIDYIVDWRCGVDGGATFRIAPATLVFHGVTDPRIRIDWAASGFQVAIHAISIDRLERDLIRDAKVFLDRPYYRWTMRLNWPAGSEIAFGAVGFTQTLLAEPIVSAKQQLSTRERQRLLGR